MALGWKGIALGLGIFLLGTAGGVPTWGEDPRPLVGLDRVAIEVQMGQDAADLNLQAEELGILVRTGLRERIPRLAVDPSARDRIRLSVQVRLVSSSELRGFYLPFSQDYGIGPVRLEVSREVAIAGVDGILRAPVWHAEQLVMGPSHGTWVDVQEAVTRLLDELARDHQRARRP